MPARSVGNGNISFGLVSIPVKLFTATRSRSVSFNLLHAKDQSRIQQKIYCPVDDAIIDRSELVRGFEIEKGRYVTFTDEELKALEARNEHAIEITEFLPLEQVDPIYYEESFYLGAEPIAGKAYRLLADAMKQTGRVALGTYTMRGKEHLVLIRPYGEGLMMHNLYYADEVRPAEDVDQAGKEPVKEAELTLAKRLIDELTHEKFEPTKYHDNFRARVLEAAERKVAGQEVTEAPAEARRGQVIDLMAALKASLEKRGVGSDQKAAAAAPPEEEKAAVGESRRRVRSRSPQPAGRRAAAKK
ncbi:MAG TPA: Ku protein [Candidatus Binataceae bacterium]|nr:Ku protein [Candidatus Binataceae bacterium]